jgi:EAL domain-containing protein (putative c-di-GMP-specific phosphodiesterase class I)
VFVPIAEQSGLMVPLGTWMMRRVFTQCRDWPACDISINLSPLQIMAQGFVETIAGLVEETGIDPHRVILEVTEGVMLDRSEHVAHLLRTLQSMGFRIALDDFGIGYSSLSYLRAFQFDRIKIDRSFVQNIETDHDAQSILSAIASLGHILRMKVVAEGWRPRASAVWCIWPGARWCRAICSGRPCPPTRRARCSIRTAT